VTPEYHCEALAAHHERSNFACGVAELDRYFRQQVTQDIRRRVTSCFVAIAANGAVGGYYTLASAGIPVSELPADLLRRLPRYPTLPAVRIGRLAVGGGFCGRGVGGLLLMDAAARAYRAEQANYALLVDAKDDAASAFYRHHGFTPFAGNPRILFLPLATAAKLLDSR
jgi:GNAT superfamily N-acetyltransferase